RGSGLGARGWLLVALTGLGGCAPSPDDPRDASAPTPEAGAPSRVPIHDIPEGGLSFQPAGQAPPAALQACQTWLAAGGFGALIAPILVSSTGDYGAVTDRHLLLLARGTCDRHDAPYVLATAVTDVGTRRLLARVLADHHAG